MSISPSMRDAKGFTLIELLIVVVIIGILAAIAIPQFSSTKTSAYIAQVKSDLRNNVPTMESEYAQSSDYTNVAQADLEVSDGTNIDALNTSETDYCIQMSHAETDPYAVATDAGNVAATDYTPGSVVQTTCTGP